MFKKLLTTMLVLSVVIAAGTAVAGDADWKFYGQLHSSINMLNNGENSQLGLTSNTSRFGFKGWKPMNDDFSFIWQFESELDMVGEREEETEKLMGTTLATRNSYIGFKNADFGKVLVGIHDTPFKVLGRKTTFFKDTIGDNRQMTFGVDERLEDLLMWVSPNWDGFNVFAAYQFDQCDDKLTETDPAAEFTAETRLSGMASYTKDEIFFGVAMEKLSEGYADMNIAGEYGDAPMGMRFAGKYDTEKFALAGMYMTLSGQEYDFLSDTFVDMSATTMGIEGLFKASEEYNFKFNYYMADPDTDVDDDSFNLLTFGIDRVFSKNVMVYVQYAMMSYGDVVYTDGGEPVFGMGGNGFGASWNGFQSTDGFENPNGFSIGSIVRW